MSAGRLRVQVPSDPPFSRSVAQSLERPAWDREAAGGNPAVPTILKLLPWSNTSGIRLLSGTMQVEILPAAPLPGGVKVARRFVKPHGVGASPTLAANSQGVMSAADGLVRNEEVAGATPATLTISRKAGRYRLAAPVSKTGSGPTGDRSVTDAFRHLPTLNERKSHETHSPLSKPIALSQELQTKSSHANPTNTAA